MTSFLDPLEAWVSSKLSLFLGFDDEPLAKYVLAISDPRDAEEYLRNLLGDAEGADSVIEEILNKRFSTAVRDAAKAEEDDIISSISCKQESLEKDSSEISSKKVIKNCKKKELPLPVKLLDSFAVTAASFDSLPSNGSSCGCNGDEHALVLNCINCGKILCDKEILPQIDDSFFSRKQQNQKTRLPSGHELYEFLLTRQIPIKCLFCELIPYVEGQIVSSGHNSVPKTSLSSNDAQLDTPQERNSSTHITYVPSGKLLHTSHAMHDDGICQHIFLTKKDIAKS